MSDSSIATPQMPPRRPSMSLLYAEVIARQAATIDEMQVALTQARLQCDIYAAEIDRLTESATEDVDAV